MEAAIAGAEETLIWPVLAVLAIGVLSAVLKERAKRRQTYLDMLAAFRWDPNMSPVEFEQHCADFLCLKGWSAKTTRGSGDQGIDVWAEKAGVVVVLQCKKYSRPVGNKAVQEAHAAKAHAKSHAAAVVSNEGYTPSAKQLAQSTGVLLLHFTDLANADQLFGIPAIPRGCAEDVGLPYGARTIDRISCPCPKCQVILRLPRGRTGTVRCPECGWRFMTTTGAIKRSHADFDA